MKQKNKNIKKIVIPLLAASIAVTGGITGIVFAANNEAEGSTYGIFRWDEDGDGVADIRIDGDNITKTLNDHADEINRIRKEVGLSESTGQVKEKTVDENGDTHITIEYETNGELTRQGEVIISQNGKSANSVIETKDKDENIITKQTQNTVINEDGSVTITTITYKKDENGNWVESSKEEKTVMEDGQTTITIYERKNNNWEKVTETTTQTKVLIENTADGESKIITIYNEDGTKTIIESKNNDITDIHILNQTILDQILSTREALTNQIDIKLIESQKNFSNRVDDVEDQLNGQIGTIESKRTTALSDLENKRSSSVTDIEDHHSDSVDDIEEHHTDSVDDIEKHHTDSVNDIENKRVGAIDTISGLIKDFMHFINKGLIKNINDEVVTGVNNYSNALEWSVQYYEPTSPIEIKVPAGGLSNGETMTYIISGDDNTTGDLAVGNKLTNIRAKDGDDDTDKESDIKITYDTNAYINGTYFSYKIEDNKLIIKIKSDLDLTAGKTIAKINSIYVATPISVDKINNVKDLSSYIPDEWDNEKEYKKNAIVTYENIIYRCTKANTKQTPGAEDASDWEFVMEAE